MDDCIFCKIISRDAPAKIVYEDGDLIAIIPREQISPGHTLLMPKKHSENVLDTDEQIMELIGHQLKKLSIQLVAENKATGLNILNANGKDAQQSVNHLHFHLVPRYPSDGLDLWLREHL